MTYNALIVDDEKLSRSYISDLIQEFEPEINILEAPNVKTAKSIIETECIDILFLDVNMPEHSGFDLLESVPNNRNDFELIFITAYSEYAIKAIKENASNYLLKPIRKSEFQDALQKAIEKRRNTTHSKIGANSSSINNEEYLVHKLALNHQQGIKFIQLKDIVYLKADNSYTTLILNNGEKITTSKPINRFEAKLDPQWFFRVHKSYIINMFHFREYISRDGDIALMNNGEKIYISRYRLAQFLSLIQQISGELKI